MNQDDLFYLIIFYLAIAAGYFDRQIENKHHKQFYGATVGFIFTLVLCGSEIIYILINISVNAWIIIFCDRKKCHIFSFIFTFSFLLYSRIHLSISFTNLILMSTTLKMIGVAFEVNSEFSSNYKKKLDVDVEYSKRFQGIKSSEIMFYGMNYVGLFGAPYYTYSTFDDFLSLPFRRYHDWKNLCVYNIVKSTMIMVLYIIVNHLWPISYAFVEEFYENESLFYRIYYVYPTAYTFIFRVWNAFILFECCSYMNGLGAYPTFAEPKCGYGPTKNFEKMASLKNEEDLKTEGYSFATIENVNILKYHSELGFGEAIKHWNTTIQFWLYFVIYKNIPYGLLRKPATMFVSSYWHGLDFGYFASLLFSSLVLVVDKRWRMLLKGEKSFRTKFFLLMMKMHLINNLAASFIWKQQNIIMKYQKSVYYNGIFLLIFAYILLLIYEKKKL